jgi:hypothetical protein
MNKKTQTKIAGKANTFQGVSQNLQVFASFEYDTLVHLFGDGRIEMPANYYRKILGLPMVAHETVKRDQNAPRPVFYGLTARPRVYLSGDGQFLIHRVFDVKIVKHVNYYKAILSSKDSAQTQANPA